jgi:hypothetical protein
VTVDELKEVLADQFHQHERHEDGQHAEIVRHFDKINGSISDHANDITNLKVRDGLWAGGLIAGWAVIKALFK